MTTPAELYAKLDPEAENPYTEEFWKAYYEQVETSDGRPVDDPFQEKEMRLLTSPLFGSWEGPPGGGPFLACANVGLFFKLFEPPIVPDVMVSLGVRQFPLAAGKKSESYFLWEYGKAPDVVVEIVSNRKGGEDSRKLEKYREIGIPYYVIHDPYLLLGEEALRGYELRGGRYRALEQVWIPDMDLGLNLWEGSFEGWSNRWLRWHRRDGTWLSSHEEDDAQRRQEQERAAALREETARAREEAALAQEQASAAKEEADRAEARAARLAAKLRDLGVEPNGE